MNILKIRVLSNIIAGYDNELKLKTTTDKYSPKYFYE